MSQGQTGEHIVGDSCHVRVCGLGLPLLLLHAGIADSRMWQPQMEYLCEQFFILAPDIRGYGKTPMPDGPFSYQRDITAVLEHFRIEKVWIIGASFGSRLGVDYCLQHPERVQGLVLLSPVLSGFIPGDEIQAFNLKEDQMLAAGDLDGATELNLKMWVDGPRRSGEQVDRRIRSQIGTMQLQAFQVPIPPGARVEDPDTHAVDRLVEIGCPVLVVVGDQDQEAVLDHAREVARGISGARIELVGGAGHMLNMEQPGKVNSLIEEFIQKQ